ncbi:DUF6934 family protein [Mucilaginibacter sp. FT3.2]|uniref:DUF6934 family protein n=1 Tax=Mucilaginibacter sp. FT3.2 TaxID=2723090 RepID=UPI00161C1957|nr:hypothetical protein [Mucilaginibacter sp. FT3.2]MBB6233754.1 hypothetical protein [Mucilaginibacter sp. FT3.2]
MQVTINFDQIYPPLKLVDTLTEMTFESPKVDGSLQEMLIKITLHPDPLLPGVFNLGFGPPDGKGNFKDDIRLKYEDLDKVFSTVLFHGLVFLQQNPESTIGIDGSDDLRARLYHRMYKSNRVYLADYFAAIGVDWYVRIFRNGDYEKDELGNAIAKPRPESFDYKRNNKDLYRYYMFRLK